MSLAAGHLREAEISAAILRQQLGRLVAIDSDRISLDTIDRDYGKYGVETVHASAREVLSGRVAMDSFDLIYSSGLCDYLNDTMSQRLAGELFARLNPGGLLLLTNFVNDIEGVGYMEAFMDWNLVYRNRQDMMAMSARIPDRQIGQVTVFSEENHNVLFIMIQRNQ
jgi:SAM-dependent methyltransferase